jgi:hypothetical protein
VDAPVEVRVPVVTKLPAPLAYVIVVVNEYPEGLNPLKFAHMPSAIPTAGWCFVFHDLPYAITGKFVGIDVKVIVVFDEPVAVLQVEVPVADSGWPLIVPVMVIFVVSVSA